MIDVTDGKKAPTTRAFFRALKVFSAEIGALRLAARQVDGPLSEDLAIVPFLIGSDDNRLEYVLEDYTAATDRSEMVRSVAAYVAPLASRIDALLSPPEGAEWDGGEASTDDVDPGVLLIFGCAERFHIDPQAVLDWPLGMFLDCIAAFSRPDREKATGHDFVGEVYAEDKTEAAPFEGSALGIPTIDSSGDLVPE